MSEAPTQPGPVTGLVLSGGGARGAYQAGVCLALGEVCRELGLPVPIGAFAGVSAGAINAAYLGAHAFDLAHGSRQLAQLWGGLTADRVFVTNPVALGATGARWARSLSLGPLFGGTARALLDTSPLRRLLAEHLPLASLRRNVASGRVRGVAVTAAEYSTTATITFLDSGGRVAPWRRRRRFSRESELGVEHVMASAAIPVFFEPVAVDGSWFGDGCLRNTAPLSPAIHLGADRLIVVGVRRRPGPHDEVPGPLRPSLARIASVLLNAVFFDAIDYDVERVHTMNRALAASSPAGEPGPDAPHGFDGQPLRRLSLLVIQPSENLGAIARDLFGRLPRVLRWLVQGLGTPDEASDLVSYLLFDAEYTRRLIELGRKDGLAVRDQLAAFLTR